MKELALTKGNTVMLGALSVLEDEMIKISVSTAPQKIIDFFK
jgi:hypothetical protein